MIYLIINVQIHIAEKMVVTKFEDDDDWGDGANVEYFNDGKTVYKDIVI